MVSVVSAESGYQPQLFDLPDEVLKSIFSMVPDRRNLKQTSRRCYNICDEIKRDFLISRINTFAPLIMLGCKTPLPALRFIEKNGCSLYKINFAGSPYVFDCDIYAIARYAPGLTHLAIEGHEITNRSLFTLARKCPGLKSFHCHCSKVTNKGLVALFKKCRNLVSVNAFLSSRKSMRTLAGCCTNLESLVLIGKNTGLGELPKFSRLRSLKITYSDINDKILRAFVEACTGLESLNLHQSSQITDSGLSVFKENGKNLTSINLGYCTITNAALDHIAEGCPSLKSLHINCCYQITDAGVKSIAQKCPRLELLDLDNCENISDVSVIEIAGHCRELASLNLRWCHKITDSSLNALGDNCPKLRSLNITACRKLTDAALNRLIERCPLQEIDITYCTNITEDTKNRLGGVLVEYRP